MLAKERFLNCLISQIENGAIFTKDGLKRSIYNYSEEDIDREFRDKVWGNTKNCSNTKESVHVLEDMLNVGFSKDDLKTKFEKVSFEEFSSKIRSIFPDMVEYKDEKLKSVYDKFVSKPERSTTGSAGYDFVSPVSIYLKPGESVVIPTGIRCKMRPNQVLLVFPRSGHGFKYRIQLDNTVAVIDSDYYYSDNEGHIMIKITNDGKSGKDFKLARGERFCQGIFLNYGITDDDNASGTRNGGFGSTSKK